MRGGLHSRWIGVGAVLLLLSGSGCAQAPQTACSQSSGLVELEPLDGGGSAATINLSNPGAAPVFASLSEELGFTLEGD